MSEAKRRRALEAIGPGLVTGAADDDPSGIGTYSQIGAQFGYGLAWTIPLCYPLLLAIQLICARIGAVTGRGIAANLRKHYGRRWLSFAVLLLLAANVVNIGADLGAMAAALELVIPGPLHLYTFAFALVSILLEVFVSYERYAAILKWATLSLLAYLFVPFAARLVWSDVLSGLLNVHLLQGKGEAMALVALLGTTISPYLFFWQSAQEVEELQRSGKPALGSLGGAPAQDAWRRIRLETAAGMAVTLVVALAMVISTAATLHAHGITEITSTAQAATALRPIAGDLAFALFSVGVIGTGLLAVPVLAGSAAYAVSETFGWEEGLSRQPRQAKAFYATIAVATLAGLAINLLKIDPMKALYWSAVLNGLLAPPLMVMSLLVATNRRIMGDLVISGPVKVLGALATLIMTATGGVFLLG